jgi:hypothetical protein
MTSAGTCAAANTHPPVMSPKAQLVRTLHDTYVARTGLEIGLNMMRERTWSEWLTWSGDSWTPTELSRCIAYLKAEIRKGNRNEGALKFSNLIGDPVKFEEDLALALKELRSDPYARRPTPPSAPAPAPVDTATPEADARPFSEYLKDQGLRR